jgi:hypothetical protein
VAAAPGGGDNPPAKTGLGATVVGWLPGILAVSAIVGFVVLIYATSTGWTSAVVLKPGSAPLDELIYQDAAVFHMMWGRWTAIDLILTFFTAGTAVSAAIKNAYSVTQDKKDKPSWLDWLLTAMAVLAVLGTTFDAKLQADQLAKEYRAGDLTLQRGKMAYEQSDKQDQDKADLYAAWVKAQGYLEQKPLTDDKPATGAGNGNGGGKNTPVPAAPANQPTGHPTDTTGTNPGTK